MNQNVAKFVWIADDDFNYNSSVKTPPVPQQQFGLISSFDSNNNPIWQPQWETFAEWMAKPSSSKPNDDSVITPKGVAVSGQMGECGINTGAPFFTVVAGPSHGTLTIDPISGLFIYTPNSGYYGQDVFSFSSGSPSTAKGTESVTVSNVPAMIINAAFSVAL